MGESRARWLPFLLVVLAFAYLWEIVSLSGVPIARDMQMFFVPQKWLVAEALRQGELALWTPFVGNGAPLLANFQSGFFYPPHWAFAALPFFWAFNWLIVFHFVLGGVGMWLLARRFGYTAAPAFGAAVVFMLGGYFASLLNLINALQGAAWAPLVAWALIGFLARRSLGAWAMLVVVGALGLLAGEPQSFLFTGAVSGVSAFLYVLRAPAALRAPGAAVAALAGAAAVVVGLTAIQLFPTIELLSGSGRGEGGLSYGEAAAFSLDPVRLVNLVVPPDFGDPDYAFGTRSLIGRSGAWLFSVYLGPVCLFLFAYAAANRPRRREAVAWGTMALVGLMIAMGDHFPLYPFLFDHLPGFSSFRFPEKYMFFVAFPAALIAAMGLERLLADAPLRGWRALALGSVAVASGARLAYAANQDWVEGFAVRFGNVWALTDLGYVFETWGASLTRVLIIVILFWSLVWLRRSSHLERSTFATLVLTLLAGDLAVAHRELNPTADQEFYDRDPLVAAGFPIDEVRRDYRYRATGFMEAANVIKVESTVPLEAQKWKWQHTMTPNVGQLYGVLQHDSWDAIKLRGYVDQRDLLEVIPEPWRKWQLLRQASVRYLYSPDVLDTSGEAERLRLDSLPGALYEMRDPLPRAYVVPRARFWPDSLALLNGMLQQDFQSRLEVALIGEERNPRARAGRPSGEAAAYPTWPGARIRRSGNESVEVTLTGGVDGYLVLTDSHAPGWTAEVDGVERPIRRANFFYRAVRIGPESREVVFRYRSPAFRTGRSTSLATLGVGMIGLLLAGWRRRNGLAVVPGHVGGGG